VDVLDAAGAQVREHRGVIAGLEGAAEGSVQAAVSVGGDRDRGRRGEEELALVGESGEDTC
jgi:hypothetical protein